MRLKPRSFIFALLFSIFILFIFLYISSYKSTNKKTNLVTPDPKTQLIKITGNDVLAVTERALESSNQTKEQQTTLISKADDYIVQCAPSSSTEDEQTDEEYQRKIAHFSEQLQKSDVVEHQLAYLLNFNQQEKATQLMLAGKMKAYLKVLTEIEQMNLILVKVNS